MIYCKKCQAIWTKGVAMKKRENQGFTFIEITVVIIILGLLAAVALPQYQIYMERAKTQEAAQILLSLLDAQFEYRRENSAYATDITDLQIEMDTAPQHFQPIDLTGAGGTVACTAGTGTNIIWAAKMTETNDRYELFVLDNGRVVCSGGTSGDQCDAAICRRLGYRPNW